MYSHIALSAFLPYTRFPKNSIKLTKYTIFYKNHIGNYTPLHNTEPVLQFMFIANPRKERDSLSLGHNPPVNSLHICTLKTLTCLNKGNN